MSGSKVAPDLLKWMQKRVWILEQLAVEANRPAKEL
jgi:hypothetical protein